MFLFMLCLFLISFFRILSSLPLCQVCLHSETPSEGRLVFYKEKCDITQGFRFKNVIECLIIYLLIGSKESDGVIFQNEQVI